MRQKDPIGKNFGPALWQDAFADSYELFKLRVQQGLVVKVILDAAGIFQAIQFPHDVLKALFCHEPLGHSLMIGIGTIGTGKIAVMIYFNLNAQEIFCHEKTHSSCNEYMAE